MPSNNALITSRLNASKPWPQRFSCKFIEPGLVSYDDHGTVLIRKETLDKMMNSFIGKPVINEMHKDVSPESFENDADGIITGVNYNPTDGWYYADFLVWDDATVRNCKSKAYSVSCAYDVKDFKPVKDAVHNNISYENEVIAGEYTHLAIVQNPRYEEARIVYNSKGGNKMNLKFWTFGKKDVKNTKEIDIEKAVVEVDGEKVPLKDLINSVREQEKQLAASGEEKLTEDTVVEIEGKETTVKNMIEAHRAFVAKNKMKNDDDDKDKKKDEDKDKAENADEDDDQDKKDKKEKAENCAECGNALKNSGTESMKNSKVKICENCLEQKVIENAATKGHFEALKNLADRRGEAVEPLLISTTAEKAKEGRNRYGSAVADSK